MDVLIAELELNLCRTSVKWSQYSVLNRRYSSYEGLPRRRAPGKAKETKLPPMPRQRRNLVPSQPYSGPVPTTSSRSGCLALFFACRRGIFLQWIHLLTTEGGELQLDRRGRRSRLGTVASRASIGASRVRLSIALAVKPVNFPALGLAALRMKSCDRMNPAPGDRISSWPCRRGRTFGIAAMR